jgi:hypothetical protein
MRWVGHEKFTQHFGWKARRERDHSEYLGVDGRIILKLVLGKQVGRNELKSPRGQGPVAGSYIHGNEPSNSIRGGEYLHIAHTISSEEGFCSTELFVRHSIGRTLDKGKNVYEE